MEKLVRDRIPCLMRKAGARGQFRVASRSERLTLLLSKLVEEAAELQQDPGVDELADVVEVIQAIRRELVISESQVRVVQSRKKIERGGFSRGFVLLLD